MERQNIETRIKAYNLLKELRNKGFTPSQSIKEINKDYKFCKSTLYGWVNNTQNPFGAGRIKHRKELFYVLGALLGDGCIYKWNKRSSFLVNVVGEKEFTNKYAKKISKCTGRKAKNYINRSNNTYFVNVGNAELFFLFKGIKDDLNKLHFFMKKQNYYENSLQFIEGFFDAEGCVKIIKEPARKTPKICLDICCTNFGILELTRMLLNDQLGIIAKYSIQRSYITKDGHSRKTSYHLRIYKKEFIQKFFQNIKTTKLKKEKKIYLKNWLNNGK